MHNQDVHYQKGNLSQEKQNRLTEIGYVFKVKTESGKEKFERLWNEKFDQLVEYKGKHGNVDIPSTFPENQTLCNWCVWIFE